MNILIIESDAALSREMREKLEGAGFGVEETSDGKGSLELIRRTKPDLVLLAVDLSAGQNGYIICGKLKKDDDLKKTPVIIVGNPDGFAQHRKLKTRADDYVSKPMDLEALLNSAGGLIGFPEPPVESLSVSELVEEPRTGEFAPEEIVVEAPQETVQGDPELDMLDAAFDDISGPPAPPSEEISVQVEEISAFSPEEEEQKTVLFTPGQGGLLAGAAALGPKPPTFAAPKAATQGEAEVRELRAKLTQLTGSFEDANGRIAEQENRLRELESELSAKAAELEAARSGGGKHDREFFALREQATKKDKEILRLKSELNEKEKELIEQQERGNQLEQQASENAPELARKEAQLKTLSGKVEQLNSEKKRLDGQLAGAREEARSALSRVSEMEGELRGLQERAGAAEAEAESLRASAAQAESQLQQAQSEAETARSEAQDLRAQLETVQGDLESTKSQLTVQATAFAEEMSSLRRRLSEMEETTAQHDRLRERTKKALSIALQLLDQPNGAGTGGEAAA